MKTYRVKRTERFDKWLGKLDGVTQTRINFRLRRVGEGNFGDHHGVGGGVSEMRLDFGRGYRLYYTIWEDTVVLLLIGGDKSGQQRDIDRAHDMLPEALKWLRAELKREEQEQEANDEN